MKILFSAIVVIFFFGCTKNQYSQRYFQFNYEVSIDSTNGKKMELWIPVPKTNEVQTISHLTYDLDGLNYELKTDPKHNNKYLYIYSENGISETKNIKLSCNVLRKEHGNVNFKNINPENYLVSYRKVPVGSIFSDVITGNKLNKNDMESVYNFVLNGMHYGKPKSSSLEDIYFSGKNPKTNKEWMPEDQKFGRLEVDKNQVVNFYKESKNNNDKYTFGNGNSLYACDIGVGNCTDYHSYFISIGRTLEVPVRFHMGFPIPNAEEGKVDGYHCWADYYVYGEGWYPVDISEADKDPSRAEYYFGTLCSNRVEFMIGRDFKIDNYEEESVNLFIYPLFEVDDKVSKEYTKKFSYKNL